MINVWIIVPVVIVLYLLTSIKILREYERGVVFRLGRVLPQAKGPGAVLVFAPIDRMVRMSLRVEGPGSSCPGRGNSRQRDRQGECRSSFSA
jgi:regulator of protease activity HflC (stomatin/prohibitin superfamily)